jgi:putative membrane protein (TIGR04086 family)
MVAPMPQIAWRAVAPGAAIVIAAGIAGIPYLGVFLGGVIAGVLAPSNGLFQGAMVAIFWVLAQALLPFEGPVDTVAIIATDAVTLALGALGGALGSRLPRRS